MNRLKNARVAVFGIGGVGGYVCEGLARSGIGALDLVDSDLVSRSNLNRQIIALESSIGRPKVRVMEERLRDINPEISLSVRECFYLPENAGSFNFESYDYVVDAVDTVTAKLSIIESAKTAKVPVISAMGAGNKLNPQKLKIADISETNVCPLARVMRRELKKRGITGLKVAYSEEEPLSPKEEIPPPERNPLAGRRDTPASAAFVPAAMGILIASEVVRDLISQG